MKNVVKEFINVANINGIEVQELQDVKAELDNIGYSGEDYFKKNNVSVVKALAANASEANAIIDVSDEEKLSCIIDTEELIILIEKDKIFNNMYKAYQEAYKTNASNYMIFVSQESKTADIEKQLISGVQGAKKLKFVVT